MTQHPQDQGAPSPKPADRKAKLVFLVVALVAAGMIWYFLQTKPTLTGWPEDINAARADARQTGRRVLAAFLSDPLNKDGEFLVKFTLTKEQNKQAIRDGKFARVKVVVDGLKSKTAQKYKITVLPTVIAFASDGTEIARIEGRIGEMPFFNFIQDVNKNSPAQQPK